MDDDAFQDRSERLASLVDGLSAALRASGVAEDAASRLLETASVAVLDALTLDLMLSDEQPLPVAAPLDEPGDEPTLLAA